MNVLFKWCTAKYSGENNKGIQRLIVPVMCHPSYFQTCACLKCFVLTALPFLSRSGCLSLYVTEWPQKRISAGTQSQNSNLIQFCAIHPNFPPDQFDSRYGNAGSRTCEMCDPSCGECVSGGEDGCMSCAPGLVHLRKEGRCLPSCPQGFYHDTVHRTCEPCHASCTTCSGTSSAVKHPHAVQHAAMAIWCRCFFPQTADVCLPNQFYIQ